MLLNHILTIEKAGGRKTDVDEYNWDERLLNVDRSVFLFLQREEEWEKQKDARDNNVTAELGDELDEKE